MIYLLCVELLNDFYMKKITALFVFLTMLGISIYVNCINSTENLSKLQLANIEALASGESSTSNTEPAEEKNAMAVDIEWYVVASIPNHAPEPIAIKAFCNSPALKAIEKSILDYFWIPKVTLI